MLGGFGDGDQVTWRLSKLNRPALYSDYPSNRVLTRAKATDAASSTSSTSTTGLARNACRSCPLRLRLAPDANPARNSPNTIAGTATRLADTKALIALRSPRLKWLCARVQVPKRHGHSSASIDVFQLAPLRIPRIRSDSQCQPVSVRRSEWTLCSPIPMAAADNSMTNVLRPQR